MIHFCKKNKLFSFLLLFTIFVFLLSLFLPPSFSKEIKDQVLKNILDVIQSIQKENLLSGAFIKNDFIKEMTSYCLFWLLGISIIGIPILLFCYFLEIVTFSFQIFFLFFHLKHYSFWFLILYLIPSILQIIGYFFLTYYAIHYSIIMIQVVIFHKDYPFVKITKRYCRVGVYLFLYFFFIFWIKLLFLSKIIPIFLSIF